jgi:hypothetical protein
MSDLDCAASSAEVSGLSCKIAHVLDFDGRRRRPRARARIQPDLPDDDRDRRSSLGGRFQRMPSGDLGLERPGPIFGREYFLQKPEADRGLRERQV